MKVYEAYIPSELRTDIHVITETWSVVINTLIHRFQTKDEIQKAHNLETFASPKSE